MWIYNLRLSVNDKVFIFEPNQYQMGSRYDFWEIPLITYNNLHKKTVTLICWDLLLRYESDNSKNDNLE